MAEEPVVFGEMSAQESGMQQAIESAIGKIIGKAQQEWDAGDHVTLGALLNMLCFGLCHHNPSNDGAISDLVKVLPQAMRDARETYDKSMHKARSQTN